MPSQGQAEMVGELQPEAPVHEVTGYRRSGSARVGSIAECLMNERIAVPHVVR